MERPGYYAIIPASVRYDETLKPNAKLLYGEITALTQVEGFCWADNEHFARLYQVDHKTISRWISQLHKGGHIEVEILHKEGNKRKITIDKIVTTYTQKSHEVVTKKSRGSDKKVTPIYENITTNIKKNKREENALAFLEKNCPSRYEKFLMEYESKIRDFQKFRADFHDTVVIEGLKWEDNILLARAGKYARNWIENQGKVKQQIEEQTPKRKNLV